MKMEFKECDGCSAKPGSPTLCKSCLHNRQVISDLNKDFKDQGRVLGRVIATNVKLGLRIDRLEAFIIKMAVAP